MKTCVFAIAFAAIIMEGSSTANDILSKKIREFDVRNCSVSGCMNALKACGVPLCYELIPENHQDSWIDTDVFLVFAGTKITVKAMDVKVDELLNQIVDLLPQYKWELVQGTEIINFFPKVGSTLDGWVPPCKSNVDISRLNIIGMENLVLVSRWRGTPPPIITIDFPGGSQRGFLNAVAVELELVQYQRRLWYLQPYSRNVLAFMWSTLGAQVSRVRLAYDVRFGEPFDETPDLLHTAYDFDYLRENDETVLMPRRVVRDLAVSLVPFQFRSPEKLLVAGEFYNAIRAVLKNDIDEFVSYCDPIGVGYDRSLLSEDELRKVVKRLASLNENPRYHLADLVDPEKIIVSGDGDVIYCAIPIREELALKFGKCIEIFFDRHDKLYKISSITW